jgi:serine/threonine-protein kinase
MADTPLELVGGRYRILSTLGKGAMGMVFMAYDPVLDRKVAIKQMTAEIADNEELRQRFYVEARAAARLNHPNIITIHELAESGGEIYMVMELLEGRSLANLIQAKPVPLSLEATLDVMGQVCDGLDYAHQRTIVHRDVKPANLFLTPTGMVKILDFGIARLGSLHMTAAGTLIGTPDYMSPEQVRGDEVDRRTDLWAVGAVLYQLLSGTKPFEGKPLARLLAAITQTPHVPLQQRAPSIPKGVSDLVDRLLAKPRDARPASAGLVRDELRAILGRETSAATKAKLVEDEYGETLFMAAPARVSTPPASVPSPGSAPPPAGLTPAVAAVPAAAFETITTPVPAPPALRPPGGHMSATQAAPGLAGAQDDTVVPASATAAPAPGPARVEPPRPAAQAPAVAAVMPVPAASTPAPAVVAATTAPAAPVAVAVPPAPAPAAAAVTPRVKAAASAPRESHLGLVVLIAVLVAAVAVVGAAGAGWWYYSHVIRPEGPKAAGQAQAVAPAPSTPVPAAPSSEPPPVTPSAAPPPAQGASTQGPAAGGEQPLTAPPPATSQAAGPVAHPPAAASPAPTPPADTGRAPSGKAAAPTIRQEPSGTESQGSGVSPAPSELARPGLRQDTVAVLAGRDSSRGYDTSQSASDLAAVKRVNLVLGEYVDALVHGDEAAMQAVRSSLTPSEKNLMRFRRLKVRLEDVRVEVHGTEATARCRRILDGTSSLNTSIQDQGPVVFSLTRKPTGWVITDVR